MTRQTPSAPGGQGNRTWVGHSVLPLPAGGRRAAVRGRFRKLRLANESSRRDPLTRTLRESAQVRTANKRDCPQKAGEGTAP
jgi:hypothetical protein